MKKLAFFLVMLAAVAVGQAQTTGTGIVLLTGSPYEFTPTTVDSTTTFEFQLVNTVGVQQIVYFGGLDAPFNVTPLIPTAVPANDTLDMELTFNPGEIGVFSDTLEVLGNVFGNADLVISGQGIQVILEWTPEELAFDTTAIGQQSSATMTITSSGNGAGTITDVVFSNDIFSLDEANSTLTIDEGTSGDLTFLFSPTGAGVFNETVELYTNDPNNSVITIPLTATGISEVSGEVCDMTWTAENSPYTLVGDIVVPDGCTLTLASGTEIYGNDFDIEVFGAFYTNGTEEAPITISCGELISHTSADQMVLTHTDVTETNEFEFTDFDYRIFRDANQYSQDSLPYWFDFHDGGYEYLYENENAADHYGKYSEDFSDNNCQGWELTYDSWPCPGGLSQTCNGNSYNQVYDNCSSSYWGWIRTLSPTFTMNAGEHPETVSFFMDTYNIWQGYNSSYIDYNIAYRVNGGSWINLENSSDYLNNATKSFDISAIEDVETIQFRMSGYFRYRGAVTVDDFVLTTNFYDIFGGVDVPATATTTSLSTGGIELHNSNLTGDFHSVNDSLSVVLDNSSIAKNADRDKDSHGLGLYADDVTIESNNTSVSDHALDGLHVESLTTSWTSTEDVIDGNGGDGIYVNGDLDWTSTEDVIDGNGGDGIYVNGDLDWTSTEDVIDGNGEDGIDVGANSNMTIYGPEIWNNGSRGLAAGDGSVIDIDYARIDGNGSHGIDLENGGSLDLDNSRLLNNGGQGVQSGSPTTLNHCNLAFNGGTGLVFTGNNFHTVNNSILWGNNETNYTQIDIGGGVSSTSYSTVQGQSGYGVTGGGQFYWGNGVIEADPLFADDELHLNTYSPCVDGGQPWLMDAYMPYGLGGVRSDMGMYGGPDNAYWGGLALPDGASNLLSVEDTPQDQGNTVGLTFSSSFYDNSDLVNNVTHYAFWRHFDPTGSSISSVDEGNWELIGEMPSLSLDNYAYQATTLGNTNAFGDFSSCYFVAAHTADDDTYWISNVACGEAIDNLAPEDPELNGLVLESGGAQISWTPPTEEDYAYTEIFNDDGFTAEVGNDTLVVDVSALAGNTYTYTAVHYDVNGNASDPVSLTLDISAGLDVINLNAGWNLISIDRSLSDGDVEELLSGLQTGNLQYVTGFQNGVQFYDPDGLSFLNTLSELDNGYGYWVKVTEDDVLEVGGASLPLNYRPQLTAGWNLIGYPNADDSDPADYFADLIAEDNLLYVTGFDQGSQVFDPNGLAFLNTLQELENGFGYWVKTVVGDDPNGMAPANTKSNPAYMVLNGSSQLNDAGGTVDVINTLGEVVATMDILEGGYLMTTAVFGADPSDETATGLQLGEELSFAYNGKLADQTITWEGGMEHRSLALTFSDVTEALTLSPNPAQATTQLTFELLSDASVNIQVSDATGRLVIDLPLGTLTEGAQQRTLSLSQFDAGVYEVSVVADGAIIGTTRLLKQK